MNKAKELITEKVELKKKKKKGLLFYTFYEKHGRSHFVQNDYIWCHF
jgi:hypothetical protein